MNNGRIASDMRSANGEYDHPLRAELPQSALRAQITGSSVPFGWRHMTRDALPERITRVRARKLVWIPGAIDRLVKKRTPKGLGIASPLMFTGLAGDVVETVRRRYQS